MKTIIMKGEELITSYTITAYLIRMAMKATLTSTIIICTITAYRTNTNIPEGVTKSWSTINTAATFIAGYASDPNIQAALAKPFFC